ncbi:unnamed protein product [Lampetra planeri]
MSDFVSNGIAAIRHVRRCEGDGTQRLAWLTRTRGNYRGGLPDYNHAPQQQAENKQGPGAAQVVQWKSGSRNERQEGGGGGSRGGAMLLSPENLIFAPRPLARRETRWARKLSLAHALGAVARVPHGRKVRRARVQECGRQSVTLPRASMHSDVGL